MNHTSIAPCGVICQLCLGFQREKNQCVGCNNTGYKPYHCTVCSIKTCAEKQGDDQLLCMECPKFPCRRIKDLDKRYRLKYGESPVENLSNFKAISSSLFIDGMKAKWTCGTCGHLLCVHSKACLHCGANNQHFPIAMT